MEKYYRIFGLLAIMLSACSGSSTDHANHPTDKTSAAPADEQPHRSGLFQSQRNVLDKARAVDGTIQNQAERERRAIDQQSR